MCGVFLTPSTCHIFHKFSSVLTLTAQRQPGRHRPRARPPRLLHSDTGPAPCPTSDPGPAPGRLHSGSAAQSQGLPRLLARCCVCWHDSQNPGKHCTYYDSLLSRTQMKAPARGPWTQRRLFPGVEMAPVPAGAWVQKLGSSLCPLCRDFYQVLLCNCD